MAGAAQSARWRAIELHIRHMPGGKFTDHVFSALGKDILRMEGPFGSFFLREDSDKPIVLLASGTGFCADQGRSSSASSTALERRPVHLYWGCRSKADLYPERLGRTGGRTTADAALHPGALRSPPRTNGAAAPVSVHQAVMADSWTQRSGLRLWRNGIVECSARSASAQCGPATDEF